MPLPLTWVVARMGMILVSSSVGVRGREVGRKPRMGPVRRATELEARLAAVLPRST